MGGGRRECRAWKGEGKIEKELEEQEVIDRCKKDGKRMSER